MDKDLFVQLVTLCDYTERSGLKARNVPAVNSSVPYTMCVRESQSETV